MSHRPHLTKHIDEDASIHELGADFNNARCLWNAEVKVILQRHLDAVKSELANTTVMHDSTNDTRIKLLNDTLRYVTAFNNYDSTEQIESAHAAAIKYGQINEWELACINNNRIDEYDEATSLLPTLRSKVETGVLQRKDVEQMLDEVKKYQSQ